MAPLKLICIVFALGCFLLAALGWPTEPARPKLTPLGLAFLTGAWLLG